MYSYLFYLFEISKFYSYSFSVIEFLFPKLIITVIFRIIHFRESRGAGDVAEEITYGNYIRLPGADAAFLVSSGDAPDDSKHDKYREFNSIVDW